MNLSTVYNIVLAVRAKLSRKSFSWRGKPVSDSDCQMYAEAIAYWVALLFDITKSYTSARSANYYVSWAMRIARLDIYDLAVVSGDILSYLRNTYKKASVEETRLTQVFKHICADYDEGFVSLLLSPVTDSIQNFLIEPNAEDLRILTQHLSFLSHLSLQSIEVDTIDEYLRVEVRNSQFPYDEENIKNLNMIIRGWFSSFTFGIEAFLPNHGGGATAEHRRGTSSVLKYEGMGKDARLTYFCRRFFNVEPEYFVPQSVALGTLNRCCKIQDVAKSLKTRRTISLEPTTLQYFQQGARKALVDYIKRHAILKDLIFIEEAFRNGEAARLGSETGQLATIDLSSASDTVTHRHARSLFHGTSLNAMSVCLRSTRAELPDSTQITLEKEAPMGSALCFPIECIIFAACMELGVRHAIQKWGYRRDDVTYLGVHGDDMVVPDWAYWDIVNVLTSIGFIVNKGKSFSSPSRFREACGVEAYDGVPIQPLKLSRRFRGIIHGTLFNGRTGDGSPSAYLALSQLCNECAQRGFNTLRAIVIKDLLKATPVVPPYFSEDPDTGIYSPVPDNYRAQSRTPDEAPKSTAGRYQRNEIRVLKIKPKPQTAKSVKPDNYEELRLFETLRASFLRSVPVFYPEDRIDIRCEPIEYRVTYSWVVKP